MKKIYVASILAISMASGCSMLGGSDTVSYKELQTQGINLAERSNTINYKPSVIKEAEIARIAVNTAFFAAKPAYERYTEELQATPALGNYFAAVEAMESEEDKRAIYDGLTPENKIIVDKFVQSSVFNEVMGGLKEAAGPALKSLGTFLALDSSQILASVDFSDLMAEKDKLALTTEQVTYLNSTVVSAYQNYQIISAFSAAK